MSVLNGINPQGVMKFFEEISMIPRGSKNEKEISNYLVNFAKERGLEVTQDEFLNVVIKKSATKGYENVPSMILQGHMDMVCEKNQGTEHDFMKDPLKLRVVDGWIMATGTTLGADNGIAVAFALALLDSKDLAHPALEVLVTSDEEMGMSGAQNLDPSLLSSKILINIDTEEEGELYVSCAGGARGVFEIPVENISVEEKGFHLKVRGLQGGHSGADIHLQRGNANKILGRVLDKLNKETQITLGHISGGSKDNAIPREADAIFIAKDNEKTIKIINEFQEVLKNELRVSDSNINLQFEEITVKSVFSEDTSSKIIDAVSLHPNGIKSMSLDIEGLVESSLNLGVIVQGEDSVKLHSAIRSSVLSLKLSMIEELRTLAKVMGISFKDSAHYPAWQYRANSKIRDMFEEVYEKTTGKKAGIKAIHAGLECGLFDEKFDNLDMISFGPDIRGAHTPEEKVSIESIERVWNYFVKVMKESKNYY